MVDKGSIPDETPRNLEEELLLAAAKAGDGVAIYVGIEEVLRDAPRLVGIYGGSPQDWDKMTTIIAVIIDGASVQVHWYRNTQTGQNVEFKFKREYPKTAPKNQ